MFEHKKINKLEDFFVGLNMRQEKAVYIYRIEEYNEEVSKFLKRYYDIALKTGVVIENGISNPTEHNLEYYKEMLGTEFQMNIDFFKSQLQKWLPRMNQYQNATVADAIYEELMTLKKLGKNDNMLKNAYIKFMCWLYYKFERVVNRLGEGELPKVLYEGNISKHELQFLSILGKAGCDIVMVFKDKGQAYQKVDYQGSYSEKFLVENSQQFPDSFSFNMLKGQVANEPTTKAPRVNFARANAPQANVPQVNAPQANAPQANAPQANAPRPNIFGGEPVVHNCTNAWIQGKGLEDILTPISSRGNDLKFYYNAFIRINGVEDKLTYQNEMLMFQQELKSNNRNVCVVEKTIEIPSVSEISAIKRGNYKDINMMIFEISKNINFPSNLDLQQSMIYAFNEVMYEEAKNPEMNLNKLMNKAVYILCWLKRYGDILFKNWERARLGCFIYLGGCKNETESIFVKFLAKLPVDVLILVPNRNERCVLEDKMLYEINFEDSMVLETFPKPGQPVTMGTAAYQAERSLDNILYQDTGLYRQNQFKKAQTINLRTMYEEIAILWDEELKYRPGFGTVNDVVNLPTLCAKVSGVKNRNLDEYWESVDKLVTDDTMLVYGPSVITSTTPNPMKAHAAEFLKNGKLQINKIKSHPLFKYRVIREDMQDFMLERLQQLIDQKIIKGTFENGTEYTIVSVALNLNQDVIRRVQSFDFTKKNPKILYINATEKAISLEDSIVVAYLNSIGFDVVFFVPTGYQSVEGFFNKNIFEEHQIGEFMYGVDVPPLGGDGGGGFLASLADKLFRRG